MMKQVLHTGQSDVKITVKVDYEGGNQISQQELENAQSLEILYAYKDYDGENVAESSWSCGGYFVSDGAYIYYTFSGDDIIPQDVDRLVGRAKITDEFGKVSYGREFEIPVMDSAL
jgi:hypothetical protein